jgi:hypothetical protein
MAGLHLSKDPFGRFPDEQFPAAVAVSIPGFYRYPNKIYFSVPMIKISAFTISVKIMNQNSWCHKM